jgi:type II secretory ATPase GspE/PulE/Tfp pilus assembly ATPase PilB-like protein
VDLLIALHKVVDVHFEVDGVTHVLESILGVKQGDILGPVPFNFIICAVMMVWKKVRDQEGRCEFRTKGDAVLIRQELEGGRGGAVRGGRGVVR